MAENEHKTSLEIESTVCQSKDHVAAALDGEVVIMSIQEGEYFMLDAVASRIWELLEKPTTVGALCDALVDEYEVERAACEQDTLELLAQMQGKGLIAVQA